MTSSGDPERVETKKAPALGAPGLVTNHRDRTPEDDRSDWPV
jgi:hypothetical protein